MSVVQRNPSHPVAIHPAVKQHLGKTIKGLSPAEPEQNGRATESTDEPGNRLAEKPKTLPDQVTPRELGTERVDVQPFASWPLGVTAFKICVFSHRQCHMTKA